MASRLTYRHRHTNTGKTSTWFRYEDKTREERKLVIFKDAPMNNHINGKLSTRPFH